jgi:hypothetical protein
MDERDAGFLGTGWGFPPEFHPRSSGARMVSAEEDVREALYILLSTRPGERVMHPAYGCGLHRLVFESVNESSLAEIRDLVERAVLFFEPRITLLAVEIDTGELPDGRLHIHLDYLIRATNSRSNMVYPFHIGEASHVVG